MKLARAIERLEALHGRPPEPVPRNPFEWILWENVAYLVDDDRRAAAFAALARKVGLRPEAIHLARPEALEAIAAGMHPADRARRLGECAAIALELGGGTLETLLSLPVPAARKALARFPGIGTPGAERILLFSGKLAELSPESNGLRVLQRLGLVEENRDWAAAYRAAREALAGELPADPRWVASAHRLLRRHGQVICRRTAPECEACPLSTACRHFGALR